MDWLPGMTTPQEQVYLRNYAAGTYSGTGEIVDLGCWLGATTLALAQGLHENAKVHQRQGRIHAYDLFTWDTWMQPWSHLCARQYTQGESFLDEFKVRTRGYSENIHIHAGNLMEASWSEGPIECVVVDAMKSPDLAKFIVRGFYPSLVPERGLVFHQDFKHYFTSWIHLIQYRLRDYFDAETSLQDSGAVVFRLKRPLQGNLDWLDELDGVSDDEVEEAFDYSMSIVGTELANVAAAKVMHFLHAHRPDEARRQLNQFFRSGFSKKSDLSVCATRANASSGGRRSRHAR